MVDSPVSPAVRAPAGTSLDTSAGADPADPDGGPGGRRFRRSVLITPGHRVDRLAKAAGLPADSLVFDLEDGVPPARKPEARTAVANALRQLEARGRERVVRINAQDTEDCARDLAALPFEHLDALLVPKVESPEQLHALDARLDELASRQPGCEPVRLIVTLETPRGVLRALEIADASPRCAALFFGSGDYTMRTRGALTERSLQLPRSLVVVAAGAVGCDALDAPYLAGLTDVEGTREDARLSRELGFAGKVVFHPAQIEVVNEVFTPSRHEVARARELISAFERVSAEGEGVALVGGEFIAPDLIPRLREQLALAEYSARREVAR